jgi:two-component system, OmpR family, response regulator ChvI
MTTALEQHVVALGGRAPALLASVSEPDLRVLVIEEGAIDRGVLIDDLSNHGLDVRTIASLDGASDAACEIDVIVLHCDRAKISSIEMWGKLHGLGFNVPVLLLTGEATPAHECLALDRGADDVIRRSRGSQVLAKRIRSAVKASDRPRQPRSGGPLIVGKLLLRPDVNRAYWNDVDLDLTLGEYNIIHLLASNVGRYMTYRALYDRLHYEGFLAGSGADGYRANVRSLVKRIRNKFREVDPTFDEIENYAGFGYCWKKPD